MQESKMNLIEKIFEGKKTCTVWNREEQKYYVSVIDIAFCSKNNLFAFY